ncbi:TPA_asm: UL14 uORF 2 [Human alphaherpesvirus 1]|nr:TPA_asm: UL14 uORF 2 [Human alphaherpesvirus 1]
MVRPADASSAPTLSCLCFSRRSRYCWTSDASC